MQIVQSSGGLSDNFVSLGTVWARVVSKGNVLDLGSDARNAKLTHELTLRYRNDLKPGDQVLFRDQKAEILSTYDLNGRRAYLVCQCAALNSTG